jgi:hypothetical protein
MAKWRNGIGGIGGNNNGEAGVALNMSISVMAWR